MYCLSDKQIDYILNDIGARGVEMESLQQNLLDHVCCIIEQNLEENGDFESFYQKTIKTFYKDELWEIEEETLLLLTYKNYYTMKKIMIMSGMFSAIAMSLGVLFKFMRWPGAGPMILLSIFLMCFIFLPLLFLLKKNETTESRDKTILAVGTLTGILFLISSLFKLMHWPGSSFLWLLTMGVMGFVFIPLYFFNGIKKPESKTNTITTTLILIIVTGFFFALTNLKSSKQQFISLSYNYLQNEELLARMKQLKNDSVLKNHELITLSNDIDKTCHNLKGMIINSELGQTTIPTDFEAKNLWLEVCGLNGEFYPGNTGFNLLVDLEKKIKTYNSSIKDEVKQIPISHSLSAITNEKIGLYTNYNLLLNLTQIQLFVLQNER